jgi:hypothetical protein
MRYQKPDNGGNPLHVSCGRSNDFVVLAVSVLWLYQTRGGPCGPRKRWEDEVPTTHEKVPERYPVSLQLRYKAKSNRGMVFGFGQTTMMSSRDIIFAPDDGLEPGMTAEIVVDWPPLLDDRHLQLKLQVTITGTQDGVAEARILTYDFRTRRLFEAEQTTEAAGVS